MSNRLHHEDLLLINFENKVNVGYYTYFKIINPNKTPHIIYYTISCNMNNPAL